jgi:hypothetical protein
MTGNGCRVRGRCFQSDFHLKVESGVQKETSALRHPYDLSDRKITNAKDKTMKKSKLNPDRYKLPGGAPVETGTRAKTEVKSKQGDRKRSRGEQSNRRPGYTTAKKPAGRTTATRSQAAGATGQISHKTGKRSGAQKAQSARHEDKTVPAARPVDGAFGKQPTQKNRTEIP